MISASLSLIHRGDWTTVTEGFEGVKIYCDFFAPNPREDYNIEVMSIIGRKDEDVKALIRRIRGFRGVKVVSVERVSWGKYYVVLMGGYRSSIRSILLESGAVISQLDVAGGIERFEILMPMGDLNAVRELRDRVASTADLIHFEARDRAMPAPPRPLETLTEIEKKILVYSYSTGFFNIPKRARLEDIARAFGITKATANYHLRNSIKKILDHLMGGEKHYRRDNQPWAGPGSGDI